MRKKNLFYNTMSSLMFQITTIICGFILPHIILERFGSEVNGLLNSIAQFLGVISFLELGVGSVVQSSLYKPLVNKDNVEISKVISSANKFFKNISKILLIYVVILSIVYPYAIKKEFSYVYTSTLIIIISISSFAQYYFGIVNRILLTADQRGYIQYLAQTIAVILNTIMCYILILYNNSIHLVKLITSLIYLLQPFIIYLYIKRKYNIDRNIKLHEEPIKQKWNGIAQHIAAVVLDGTDIIVLTLFSTLSNVSIYSVYYLVVKGVKQLFLSMTSGITALTGELWARKEYNKLKDNFSLTEWIIHTSTVLVFSITMILIVPFVKVYTRGIEDINYIQPIFAILIVIANSCHCLRLPYNIMILAAGQYKETQNNYIVATILNVLISILCVREFGIIGVAIGTIIAMLYQTIWMAYYNSKNLIQWPLNNFIKQIIIDVFSIVIIYFSMNKFINIDLISYYEWIVLAMKVSIFSLFIISLINYVFYKQKVIRVIKIFKK